MCLKMSLSSSRYLKCIKINIQYMMKTLSLNIKIVPEKMFTTIFRML